MGRDDFFFGPRHLLETLLRRPAFLPGLRAAATAFGALADTDGRYWTGLAAIGTRGAALVGLVALPGYALATLTRRTTMAFGVALACRVAPGLIMRGYVPAPAEHKLCVVAAARWQFAHRNVVLRRPRDTADASESLPLFGGSRQPFHQRPRARSLTLPWPVPLAPERATQDT